MGGKICLALFAALCFLGAVRVTAQNYDDCDEDSCKGVTCPSVLPCYGRHYTHGGTPCGCCPLCIKAGSPGLLGVGVGKRCGYGTYISCAAYLECRLGICQYRKKIV